jgi:two-component system, response regulator YesN
MKQKTILLVDDDALVRNILRSVLEREHRILEASGYRDAVNHVQELIDIAIVDYVLPDGDGFDIAKALRQKRADIPIILITAYDNKDVILRALRAGITDYIKKPLCLRYLVQRVRDLLAGKAISEYAAFDTVSNRQEFIMDGIKEYIEINFKEDLPLDKLAKIIGMNKFDFSKIFKGRFGKSYLSYLNDVRIEKAAELLENDELSITDVVFFVGYKSVEHFDRLFKKQYGMSPRDYRKALYPKSAFR